MASIRGATPQALPILRVTFKTSSVSSWWWDLFFILFFFSFCANTKIKITRMLSLSKSSPSCFIPPGALGNRLRVFSSLDDAVVLFYGSCGKAIHVKPSTTHPPVGFLQCQWVVALAKMKGRGFVPWGSICAFQIHFQAESSLPPWLGWIIVHTGFTAVLVAPEALAGPGRLIPREFPSPGGGCQLRNILDNIFWLVPVVISRKSESQGLTSIYWGE